MTQSCFLISMNNISLHHEVINSYYFYRLTLCPNFNYQSVHVAKRPSRDYQQKSNLIENPALIHLWVFRQLMYKATLVTGSAFQSESP